MEIQRRIIWDESALNELVSALQWISQSSVQGAEVVEDGVLNAIVEASHNPERHPPDKYKRNNPGNFRAFEIHNYRVSYCYTNNEIQNS